MDPQLEDQLAAHSEQLQLLGAELDRQRASYRARVSALNSRAALLIGTASIAAGFQAAAKTSPWQTAAVLLTVLAAIFGVLAMWPRKGDELNLDQMVDVMYDYGPRETEWNLLKHKLHVHNLDERASRRRHSFLSAGFIFLALSIVCTGLRVFDLALPLELGHPRPVQQTTQPPRG